MGSGRVSDELCGDDRVASPPMSSTTPARHGQRRPDPAVAASATLTERVRSFVAAGGLRALFGHDALGEAGVYTRAFEVVMGTGTPPLEKPLELPPRRRRGIWIAVAVVGAFALFSGRRPPRHGDLQLARGQTDSELRLARGPFRPIAVAHRLADTAPGTSSPARACAVARAGSRGRGPSRARDARARASGRCSRAGSPG